MACLPRNGYVVIYSLEEIKRKFSLLTKNTVEVYYLTVIQMFKGMISSTMCLYTHNINNINNISKCETLNAKRNIALTTKIHPG